MANAQIDRIDRLLEVAAAEIGTKENPANSNNVKYNTWFYGRGVNGKKFSWCCSFVAWCFDRAGLGKLWVESNPKITAYCPFVEGSARESKQWVTGGYRRGDVVLFQFDADPQADHIGIVEGVREDSSLTTIEGNTSSGNAGSQSDGGMVARRIRKLSVVKGAFRPRYAEEAVPDAPGTSAKPEAPHWAQMAYDYLNGIGLNLDKNPRFDDPITRGEVFSLIERYDKSRCAKHID